MSDIEIYRCTPREIRSHIADCLEAGLVPFVQSSPGMGKSTIVRGLASDYRLDLIDHRLSTSAPEDLSGLPRFDERGRAVFAPFADLFPLDDQPIPDGKDGWMLFLDEANAASKAVQAASYKLVLDKMVGQRRLHKAVAIVMAGNLATDRAITNPLSTAMQSRVVHLEMVIDFNQWLEDVAFAEGYDERIIAFLSWKEKYLMDFRPDHHDKTFCCPRTWEFMQRLVRNKDVVLEKTSLYAGTITSGVAAEFVQFCQIYKDLVTVVDVLRDPRGTEVPRGADRKWAVVSHLVGKTTDKNLADIATYINRFDLSFRVLYFRAVLNQQPELRPHPDMITGMIEVVNYLNGK